MSLKQKKISLVKIKINLPASVIRHLAKDKVLKFLLKDNPMQSISRYLIDSGIPFKIRILSIEEFFKFVPKASTKQRSM